MTALWKQILVPGSVVSGDNHTTPFGNVNSDGELIVLSEDISGTTTAGPYPLVGSFVGYNFFGVQDTSQQTAATATIPNSTALNNFTASNSYSLAFPANSKGGAAFYLSDDGAGHWVINNDTISSGGGDSISQSTTVIDGSLPDSDTILGMFSVAPAAGASAGKYGIAYAVFNSGTSQTNVLWQGYNSDGSKANASPVSLTGGFQATDSTPAGFVAATAGAIAMASENINGSGGHFIHFQSFNFDGTTNTAIGGNTGHFDLNSGNADVSDIKEIRFHQFSSTSPGNSASTFAVADDEVHTEDGLNHVMFRFDHSGTVTTTDLGTSATKQHVVESNDINTGISYVAWGDTGSSAHGAHIAEFDSNGALVATTNADIFFIDDGRFRGITSFGDGRVGVEFIKTLDAPTNTTQGVIDIVDFRTPGQVIDDHTVNNASGKNNIAGTIGNDTITGSDANADLIAGAAGSDIFVFDSAAFTNAATGQGDEIADYNQGNTGLYSAGEGDQVNVSAIVQTALTGGQAVNDLVRVVAAASGADTGANHAGGALLQVDSDGTANGVNWVTIAQLDGIHQGDTVNAIVNASAPAGSTLGVLQDVGFTGDFNGDGSSDLLFRNDNGDAYLWDLSGTSLAGQGDIGNPGANWHIVGIGHFNGANDSNSDILWQNQNDGSLYAFEMNGPSIVGQGALPSPGNQWKLLGVGDFNGDHNSDLIWQNNSTNEVFAWQMNGTAFQAGASFGTLDGSWHVAGIGDINHDGKDDLIWRNVSGDVYAWEMNGTGALAGQGELGNPGTSWHIEGLADLNGDGNKDIIWRNDDGSVYTWELNGTSIVGQGAIANPGSAWQLAGTGDINHDGHDDLIWRNTDGTLYAWEMNGTAIAGQGTIGNPGNVWDATTHHYDFV